MEKINFKKILPYLAGIVIFVVITMLYFSPLLEGKKMMQSDIVNFQGASKEIVDYRNQTGEEALWTNSMFGGMPAYQISAKYTGNILSYVNKIIMLGLPGPANLVFLYFAGFFLLLLVMKVDPWLSIAGAIAYALSTFFFLIIDAGHNSQAHAIGYVAPTLAGIILVFRKKYLWGGILTALFLSLEVYTNHPQITYYMVMIAVIYGIAQLATAIREKEFIPYLKSVGVITIAAIFALLTNITSLWATYEYGKFTIRGPSELSTEKHNRTTGLDRDYVTQWSYGKLETMTFLIPNFYGGSSNYVVGQKSKIAEALREQNIPESSIRDFVEKPASFMYWGDQPFTSGPVYIGAIVCFLFILGLFIVKGLVKWWLLAATLISVMLAWGHNFMAFTNFFLDYVPGYNKFRAVTMILVIAEFTMPLLGILAVKQIMESKEDRKHLFKALKISVGIAGGLALVFLLMPGMFLDFVGQNDKMFEEQYKFPGWLMQAIRDERLSMVRTDAVRALVFILLAAGLIWAMIYNKIKKQYVPFILMVLFLVDMVLVNKRFVNNDSFTSRSSVENPFTPSGADEQILQDKSLNYRVLNLAVNTFNDASTSYYHKSIGGYHGAKLRRYQELIDAHIRNNNMDVLNMLNTKYIIFRDQNNQEIVQRNPDALGNAWFVKGFTVVDNADQELNALTDFNPKDTAIIDKIFNDELKSYIPGRDSLDNIVLEEYKPNRLLYSYRAKNDGLAVFSEIYYPKGWNAEIDGKPASHFRVNYLLRAMVLPAGTHKVEFSFEPDVYFVGEKISLISSSVLLLLIVAVAGFEIRRAVKAGK